MVERESKSDKNTPGFGAFEDRMYQIVLNATFPMMYAIKSLSRISSATGQPVTM